MTQDGRPHTSAGRRYVNEEGDVGVISYSDVLQPTILSVTASVTEGTVPLPVAFFVETSRSLPPGGFFFWDYGDGAVARGALAQHV